MPIYGAEQQLKGEIAARDAEMPRGITPSEEQASHEREALEKYISGARTELEEIQARIGGHETALDALRTRGAMLRRALAVIDDEPSEAPRAPQPERTGY